MAAVVAVHPHGFDNGLLQEKIPSFVRFIDLPTYWVPDGKKEPYGGSKIYNKKLDRDQRLGKYGRASLTDEEADALIEQNDILFIIGGNFDECVASTYDSLVRSVERLKRPVKVVFITDLIYVQIKKSGEVWTLAQLMEEANRIPKKFLRLFNDSPYIERGYITAQKVIAA